jgi:hypothetical protein
VHAHTLRGPPTWNKGGTYAKPRREHLSTRSPLRTMGSMGSVGRHATG